MKVLKSFEFKARTQSKRDWSVLLDGQIRQLDKEDFGDAKATTITTQARTQARKRGKVVKMQAMEDGSVILQASDATSEQKKEWAETDAAKKTAKAEKAAAKKAAKAEAKKAAETPATPPAAKPTVPTGGKPSPKK